MGNENKIVQRQIKSKRNIKGNMNKKKREINPNKKGNYLNTKDKEMTNVYIKLKRK